MSVREYTSATVTINGVRVPVEGVTFGALRDADPHAEEIVEARVSGEMRINPGLVRAIKSALLGGAVGASGRLYPDGARGCFHEGCDSADVEEGGSHWCRWAP